MSRSLTTPTSITVVSITNTLMNQSAGAHALSSSARRVHRKAAPGSDEESDESDGYDSGTVRDDNIIRAVWSIDSCFALCDAAGENGQVLQIPSSTSVGCPTTWIPAKL